MTWTYSGNPAASALDQVRLLVGDTLAADPLLQDEEITWLLASEGGPYTAAWQAARSIAARFARMAQTTVGDLSLMANQKYAQYEQLAAGLRRKMVSRTVTPLFNAESVSGKQADETNVDAVSPAFTRDLMTAPGTDSTLRPSGGDDSDEDDEQ